LKPAYSLKAGDVLTVNLPGGVKVVEVRQDGTRRGPFAEACQLYQDLTPKPFSD
jgi:ribosome-associated heat shock protein Hsp15